MLRTMLLRAPLVALSLANTVAGLAAQTVSAEKFVLENGLQVILHQDRALPIATVNLWYYVGSKDEAKGRSGFAHLFEHLMFMGTKRVPGSGFDDRMEAGGGANNASTSSDRTNYYSWGPAELLPTLLWLEADRMEDFGKALTQDKLDKQREVVRNERRQVVEMRPYGKASEFSGKLLYPPRYGYHTSVIGSHEDLEAATLEDVKSFFATYYVPNNASLVVAGDFELEPTRALIRKLFGSLPRGAEIPRKQATDEPIRSTRRWTGYDRVSYPKVTMIWKSVPLFGEHDAELDIVAGILASGKNARLRRRLVDEEKLAVAIDAYQSSRYLGGEFHVEVTALPTADRGRIESIVREELTQMAEKGPSEDDLGRRKTRIEFDFVRSMENLRSRADRLNLYNFYLDKPDSFATDLARYRRATAASVQAAASMLLRSGACLVQTVLPEKDAPRGDRDTAPRVEESGAFRFAKPTSFTLSNGIRVQHWERATVPMVRIALQTRIGTLVDDLAHAGRTTLMTKMLEEGAGARDTYAFANALEKLGATLRTSANRDDLRIEAQCLAANFDKTVELWRDAICAPRMDAKVWERTQRLHLAELERARDNPSTVARQVASRVYFGEEHPFGIPALGSVESVRTLSLDDMRAAHAGLVRPENATIFLAGAIDADEARAILEKALGSWSVDAPAWKAPEIQAPQARSTRVVMVDRPRSPQTVVRFVMPGPSAKTPKRVEYEVLNTILGGSFTSRLNANLREKHGYTYGAGSSFVMWPQSGIFVAASNIQQRHTGKAIGEFLGEFRRIGKGDIDAVEAGKGRATERQNLVSSLGGLSGLLNAAMELAIENKGFEALDARMASLVEIDAASLNTLASRAIDLERACLVLVGNKMKVLPQLQGLGLPTPIEVDLDGRRLDGRRLDGEKR